MTRLRRAALLVVAACTAASAQPAPLDVTRWLARDVAYLITPEERAEFQKLPDGAARRRFVEAFWKRRDPTPETAENEFYDEHMRRLEEADRRFSSGVAGWRTDRGRIYVTWGPPDFVETNPAGVRGFALGPWSEAPELPTEIWTYEHLPGRRFGSGRMQIVFVDRGGGDYRLLTDPNDANLAYVYRLSTPANPLQYESAVFNDEPTGLKRTDRVAEMERAKVLGPDSSLSASANPFERIELTADLRRSPAEVLAEIARSQRARGLEADVEAALFTGRFPVALDVPVFQTAGDQAYCPLAVSIPGDAITFEQQDRYRATLVVHGEVRDERSGRSVRRFTETVEFRLTPETYARGRTHGFSYHKGLTLPPGQYLVDVAVKDEGARAVGLALARVAVPGRPPHVDLGSLVLAERVARVGSNAPPAPFTLGALDVVPRVARRFRRDELMYLVCQVTGFESRDGGPRLTVDYTILQRDTIVLRTDAWRLAVERTAESGVGAAGGRVVLAQAFELGGLLPGAYTLQVKVIDHGGGRHAIGRIDFTIVPDAP